MLLERTNKALDGIRKCSIAGRTKVKDLFEIMVKHPDLWVQAYANIYSNKGAGTKGIDDITQDGFSDERVNNLIQLLKQGNYHPKPSRRIYIPKANGKKRPLGIASGDDKLVQEVIRMILEIIYEPGFVNNSHGFRPRRSCHTALEYINKWNGAIWFIEFDIKGFYDNMDHQIMVNILEQKIDDAKFLQIIRRMLRAGYLEDWKYNRTYTGVPQGSIVSPILSNIYLNELDKFVLNLGYNKGKKPSFNPVYKAIQHHKYKLRQLIKTLANDNADKKLIQSKQQELNELSHKQRLLPSRNPVDPNYRKLWYCRYADDILVGLIGTKQEANILKEKIELFLKDNLHLNLSEDKTAIRHAKTEKAVFLGHEIKVDSSTKLIKEKKKGSYCCRRTVRAIVSIKVPPAKVENFCQNKRYGQWQKTKANTRTYLMELSDAEIISTYNAELRGFANFYAAAKDVKKKLSKLFYIAHDSLIRTLAAKYKTNRTAIYSRLKQNRSIELKYKVEGKTKSLKVFKLSELKVNPQKYDNVDEIPNTHVYSNGTELLRRWYAQECEICKCEEGKFEIHHINRLSNIKDGKQKWQKLMMARRRKTLVLCVECHYLLHQGKLPDYRFKDNKSESRMP